jgi:hypothetical protein
MAIKVNKCILMHPSKKSLTIVFFFLEKNNNVNITNYTMDISKKIFKITTNAL